MITRKKLEKILEDSSPFKLEGIDHDVIAINLLRQRIPFEVCPSIICSSEHDVLYLCEVDKALEYLSKEDAEMLAECNVGIEDDRFYLYT